MKAKIHLEKEFIHMVGLIAIPIALQQLVETFVSLADSVMVSQYSSIGVSSVQVASQWENIAALLSFGICSGVGIYISQFYGAHKYKELKKSFSMMLLFSVLASLPFVVAGLCIPDMICGFFIKDTQVILGARSYLMITSLSYIFIMISYAFNYALRCIGLTRIPMLISGFTVILNCILNYFFIFGVGFFPEWGIFGAGVASLFSRALGSLLYFIYSLMTHQVYLEDHLRNIFKIDMTFIKPMVKRVWPSMVNEFLFGIGMSLFVKAYALLGAQALTGVSIAERIANIFNVVIWGLVSAVQAIVGAKLGAGDIEMAKEYSKKFMVLGFIASVFLGGLLFSLSYPIVYGLYPNEPNDVKASAMAILWVFSFKIFLRMFNSIFFGFLRAGGDTKVIAILDSGLLYGVGLPLAFLCLGVWHLDIRLAIFMIQLEQVIRIILAYHRYRSGQWLKNVTKEV